MYELLLAVEVTPNRAAYVDTRQKTERYSQARIKSALSSVFFGPGLPASLVVFPRRQARACITSRVRGAIS